MATSRKTAIIERLFDARWDDDAGVLTDPTVTLEQVSEAISEHNAAHAH